MWQLIINGPGYFDTAYELPDGTTTVGRADENDIVLSGDLVSRKHARFHSRDDVLEIEDLGSRNGSKVNGQPLHGTTTLNPGDTLSVGENSLAIRRAPGIENAQTEVVDLGAGGVRRFGQGLDIGSAVILAKDVRDSVLLRYLDNVAPFDTSKSPFADSGRSGELLTARTAPGVTSPLAYESLLLL